MRHGILAALLWIGVSHAGLVHGQGVAGTYAIWLCRPACTQADTAAAHVAGYLVLFDAPIAVDTVAFPYFREPLDDSMFLLRRNTPPTACFRLSRRPGDVVLMAGIIPVGFTHWDVRGDSITVPLYASPDAGYTLRGRIQQGRLTSTGREAGFIGTAFDKDAGVAHGLRIGPPDLSTCRPTDRGS